jgi:cellulose synthase (UDP-forming)
MTRMGRTCEATERACAANVAAISTCILVSGDFSINTIAHGDGPTNFEDAMRQGACSLDARAVYTCQFLPPPLSPLAPRRPSSEYQWARSAMVLLTRYTWRYWRLPHMTPLERFHVVFFYFYWLWQSALVLLTAVITIAPAWGLLQTGGFEWGHWMLAVLPPYLLTAANWLWVRRQGWMRPSDAWLVTYESVLHRTAAPFWIGVGVLHGLAGGLFGVNFDIKVTPKGEGGVRLLGLRVIAPILAFSAAGSLTLLLRSGSTRYGMLLFYASSLYGLCAAVAALHYAENHAAAFLRGSGVPFPTRNALRLGCALGLVGGLLGVACARDALALRVIA